MDIHGIDANEIIAIAQFLETVNDELLVKRSLHNIEVSENEIMWFEFYKNGNIARIFYTDAKGILLENHRLREYSYHGVAK